MGKKPEKNCFLPISVSSQLTSFLKHLFVHASGIPKRLPMHRNFAKLLKLPDPHKYLDFDFYDDPYTIYTDNHLYKDKHAPVRTGPATERTFLFLYPKDIEIILGITPKQAWRLINIIRIAMGLDRDSPVSVPTFCEYTGIDKETVNCFMEES